MYVHNILSQVERFHDTCHDVLNHCVAPENAANGCRVPTGSALATDDEDCCQVLPSSKNYFPALTAFILRASRSRAHLRRLMTCCRVMPSSPAILASSSGRRDHRHANSSAAISSAAAI